MHESAQKLLKIFTTLILLHTKMIENTRLVFYFPYSNTPTHF